MPPKKKKIDLKKVLLILTIFSTISGIGLGWWGIIQKSRADKLANDCQLSVQITREYIDKNGILIKENENLTLSKIDLKKSSDTTIRKLLVELVSEKEKRKELERLLYLKNNIIKTSTPDSIIKVCDSLKTDSIKRDSV
jgi:CRISPR/Cas system CMR subunit Cmr4 (Cas7 group RAMP superfamily)